jgi:selenocysteine-specific elongation factor
MVLRSRLESTPAAEALRELLSEGKLVLLEDGAEIITSDVLAIALPHWNILREQALLLIQSYHADFPLRRGIPREELKSKLKISPRLFNAVMSQLVKKQLAVETGKVVSKHGHEIQFNELEQARVQALMRKFQANPFSPPSVKESQVEVGEDVFGALIELGELFVVSADVVFKTKDYNQIVEMIREALVEKGRITLAETRDMLNTTRKYAQAVLEHLDMIGVTTRDGDARRIKN